MIVFKCYNYYTLIVIHQQVLILKGGENMAKSKLVKANEKIAENVTTGFKKMSDGVVNGFNKMSDAVVGGYTKIEDKFVDEFLTKDGETVSEAKKRLKQEAENRKNK